MFSDDEDDWHDLKQSDTRTKPKSERWKNTKASEEFWGEMGSQAKKDFEQKSWDEFDEFFDFRSEG